MFLMIVKKGQVVTFKPEWMDDGDESVVFVALEDSSVAAAGGVARVLIEAQLGMPINPTQIVTVDMIASSVDVP
jgi:hypothetical protein